MPTLKLVGHPPPATPSDVLPFPRHLGSTIPDAERMLEAMEEALGHVQSELNGLEGPFHLPDPSPTWPPSAA